MKSGFLTALFLLVTLMADPATVPAEEAVPSTGQNIQVHLQLGFMGRLAGGSGVNYSDDNILTGDLGILFPISDRSSLGLGIKVAGKGHTVRHGLKGIWRTRLSPTSKFYFQLSPGIYVGGESDIHRFPGGFLEAELGFTNFLALTTAVEFMPYTGYKWEPYAHDFDFIDEPSLVSGTDVSWFMGVKGGQWPVVLVALLAAGISQINMEFM